MNIPLRTQRFAGALFLLLSFQVIHSSSINITRSRSASKNSNDSSSLSFDDSPSRQSSRSFERSSSRNSSNSDSHSKTFTVDSCADTKTETKTQQKSERFSCGSSSSTKEKDDEEYESRRDDFYRKEEQRKQKEADEQWVKDTDEADAVARRRSEKIRLEQIEFEQIQQTKTAQANVCFVATNVQVKIETEKKEIPSTICFTSIDRLPDIQSEGVRVELQKSKFVDDETKSSEIKINDHTVDLKQEFQASDQELKQDTQEDDGVKIFIPTREFFEKNKEYFAIVKKVSGHRVFIPESFRLSQNNAILHQNHYQNQSYNSACVSSGFNENNFQMNPFDLKDPRNKKNLSEKQIMAAAFAMLAQMVGVVEAAAMTQAGSVAAVTITLSNPVLVGGIVVGFVATVVIPGLKKPVPFMVSPDTTNMTKEEYEKYLEAKKQFENLEKQSKNIQAARVANDLVFKNGVCTGWNDGKGVPLAPVDPALMYGHGSLQRALDTATSIPTNSGKHTPPTLESMLKGTDKIAFFDGKIIKFTQETGSFGPTNHYKATLVEDLGQLTEQDKKILHKIFGINAKEELKKEKQPKEKNKTDNSGSDQGSKDGLDKNNGAQAPGKPTEKDGFMPPKNWDGKKVRHRRGYGWPDSKGNIWIPSGPNGHGGPHWDVQKPNGDYENIVPGGKIRGQK